MGAQGVKNLAVLRKRPPMSQDVATKAPWAATRAPWASPDAVEGGPRKRINTQADLEVFTSSQLCEKFVSFACELGVAVRSSPCGPERLSSASATVRELTDMLDEFERWVDDFPPLQQPMRFGNRAFSQWHERLVERGEDHLRTALRTALPPVEVTALATELAPYLHGSFGDPRRIDYGTGHEASFFAVLFALSSRGVLAKSDAADIVLVVFAAYIRVMRKLQTVYVLEPAGSHGVWGLDDFHALPFLFGSAQLIDQEEEIPTASVAKEEIQAAYADRYLYIDAIRQVMLMKRGAPFHETSPMLYDITSIPSWLKIHNGLVKMYRVEVLGKFPVIRHFLFGTAIPWPGDSQ